MLVNERIAGMFSVAAGVSVFSFHDAIVKGLSGVYPFHQIVFIRSVVALPVLLLIALAEGRGHLTLHRPRLHLLRGIVMYVAFTAYYLGLARLQMAETVALTFSAPLFIAALSVPVLGERVERRSWAAIGVGFLGVLILVRPGTGLADIAAAFPVMAALAYALSALFARRLGTTESGGAMALSATVVYILASGIMGLSLAGFEPPPGAHVSVRFLLNPWAWPSAADLGRMAGCGVLAALGFFFLGQGYRLAQASLVAPFEYVALPWSALWGYLFFGALPDATMIIGAAIVVGSGLYTLQRAGVRKVSGASVS